MVWARLDTLEDAAKAIKDMLVRGAPLIGATAAYGMALALASDASDARVEHAYKTLYVTRPTAVNLRWALDAVRAALLPLPAEARRVAAWTKAAAICDEDVAINGAIGDHGLAIVKALWDKRRARRGDAAQHPDPLQCGVVGHRRLGHRNRADLQGARCRHPGPCLGR